MAKSSLNFALLVCLLQACAGCQSPPPSTAGGREATLPANFNEFAFIDSYRISHYLRVATELQELGSTRRANRLREMAIDPRCASEVYPLCRMLFRRKNGGDFRGPLLGAPVYIGARSDGDWPLEPITLDQGIPILVVTGYLLGGQAEPPRSYVEYCLSNCEWRQTRYIVPAVERVRTIVDAFIASRPGITDPQAAWLHRQAE
jgi:hypothetical protein